jgi:hypothetical protein
VIPPASRQLLLGHPKNAAERWLSLLFRLFPPPADQLVDHWDKSRAYRVFWDKPFQVSIEAVERLSGPMTPAVQTPGGNRILVVDSLRTFKVPPNENYVGDPIAIVRDIEARTNTRLRDGENPVWFIRLHKHFMDRRDPAANVSFADYCEDRHSDKVERVAPRAPLDALGTYLNTLSFDAHRIVTLPANCDGDGLIPPVQEWSELLVAQYSHAAKKRAHRLRGDAVSQIAKAGQLPAFEPLLAELWSAFVALLDAAAQAPLEKMDEGFHRARTMTLREYRVRVDKAIARLLAIWPAVGEPNQAPAVSQPTPADLLTTDELAKLAGVGRDRLLNVFSAARKAKETDVPTPAVKGSGSRHDQYSYNASRPFLRRKWPACDQAGLFPAAYADAKAWLNANQ